MLQVVNESYQVDDHQIAFKPLPGSQALALDTRAHDTLYHGTRGPGKTLIQAMFYRRYVGIGYGAYWRGVIFDREFKNLSDIVAQTNKMFPRFNDGAVWRNTPSSYYWEWPTGERLYLRHVKKLSDYDDFHGHEYPFIGWNELTRYPDPKLYLKFMSVNRSSFDPEQDTPYKILRGQKVYQTHDRKPLHRIPHVTFATTNPDGPGHNWVKRMFIDVAPPGKVFKREFNVFNPTTQKEEVIVRKQVAIFGSYKENRYLDGLYVARLNQLCENNPNLEAAWLHGSWDVNAGGAIDDLWRSQVHIIPPFNIPDNWIVDRAMDWGSTAPYAIGFFAKANGEEIILPNGIKWAPPRGTLFLINEIYGAIEVDSENIGVKKGSKEVAREVLTREREIKAIGLVKQKIRPGPADNSIRDVDDKESTSIELNMQDEGVYWTTSDKSKGSRRIGLQMFRDRLTNSLLGEGPGFYVFNTCHYAISTIPGLPRDEDDLDDVDTDAEDHMYDMVRYKVLDLAKEFTKWKTNYRLPGA